MNFTMSPRQPLRRPDIARIGCPVLPAPDRWTVRAEWLLAFPLSARLSRCLVPQLGALLLAMCFPVCGQGLIRFEAPVLRSGVPILTLLGQETNYVVESSTDLRSWHAVLSAPSSNGRLSFLVLSSPNSDPTFYRARAGWAGLPGPLTVRPTADPKALVTSLVTPARGGELTLLATNGLTFTLSVPPAIVTEATTLTMTRVTNVTGSPFAAGILGAVRLEPENLPLFGAAVLTISYPAGVDRRRVASFTCGNDGSAFHLTLDRAYADRVTIPVTHLGTVGACLATLTELTRREVPPVPVNFAPKLAEGARSVTTMSPPVVQGSGSAVQCFPGEVLMASLRRRQIMDLQTPIVESLARSLTIQRQKQLAGATEDAPQAPGDLGELICDFYISAVSLLWKEAEHNCPLAQALAQITLGYARQLQLTGYWDSGGACVDEMSVPWCTFMHGCIQETEDCCRLAGPNPARVLEILATGRQDALMGGACLSAADLLNAIDTCTNMPWNGAIRMVGRGQRSITTPLTDPLGKPVGTETQEQTSETEIQGGLIQSDEDWDLDPTLPTVYLTAQVAQVTKYVLTTTRVLTTGKCPETRVERTEYDIRGGGTIAFELLFHEDSSYELLAMPTVDASAEIQSTVAVRGCQNTFTRSVNSGPWGGLGASIFVPGPPLADLKRVQGTQESNKLTDWPPGAFPAPVHWVFDWDFRRKQDLPWGPR